MKKTFLTIILIPFFLAHVAFASDNKIKVVCTGYRMNITNISNHSLKIYALRGREVFASAQLVEAGGSMSINKMFTKAKLRKISIICRYDEDAFYKDKKTNESNHEQRLNNLSESTINSFKASATKFGATVSAQYLSTIKTESNDDWLTRTAKSFGRGLGNLTKGGVYAYESAKNLSKNLQEVDNKQYSNFFNFAEDLKKLIKNEKELHPLVDEVLSPLLDAIKEDVNWADEKSKQYYKKRILYLAQDLIDDFKQSIQREKVIEQEYDNRANELKRLKDDNNFANRNTYNAYIAASQNFLDLKKKTPIFTLSVEPLCYGSDLNQYWKSPSERLFKDEDKDNQLEWGEGLLNSTLGGSIGVTVSPEMWLGANLPSRLYAEFGYYQTLYRMNTDTKFRLSNNFFSKAPTGNAGFSIANPPIFYQQKMSFGLTWRFFIGRKMILDLNGGYDKISGKLDLSEATLSQGFVWASEKVNIVNDISVPHYGLKLGYGFNKFRGVLLSCGAQFYDSKQENLTLYKLTDSNLNKPISFSSDKLNYRLFVGFTTQF
jgi:hypothetical protein